MFRLTSWPIDGEALARALDHPAIGAWVVFEGKVRNRNEGRDVISLEYEAYEDLAQAEAARIFEEARRRFPIQGIVCTHRVGRLSVTETAVWLGVSAEHRGAAFRGCEYVIDQIKLRLPIWKKETYSHGAAEWIACKQCGHP